MPKDLNATLRAAAIADLRRTFEPHMWESGYRVGRIGNSRPLKLWAPRDEMGECTSIKMGGFVLTDFLGYAETGVMTDAHGGGLVTTPFEDFPMEDLAMLNCWAVEHFATPSAAN